MMLWAICTMTHLIRHRDVTERPRRNADTGGNSEAKPMHYYFIVAAHGPGVSEISCYVASLTST